MGHLNNISISLKPDLIEDVVIKCDAAARTLSISLENVKAIVDSKDFLITKGGFNLAKGEIQLTAPNVMVRVVLSYSFEKVKKMTVPKFTVD